MLLNSFKLGGFKVFGEPVELNMTPESKNTQHLKENIIERKDISVVRKNLKSSIIYGGNNTGKSSLLDGLIMMKKLFKNGNIDNFSFNVDKNFCYDYDELVSFEVSFLKGFDSIIYGFEFKDKENIGEYLFLNDELLFSRDLNGKVEGEYMTKDSFKNRILDLPNDKLIVPYFLEYTKTLNEYNIFTHINTFFDKIIIVDNKESAINISLFNKFIGDSKRMSILNKIISSTELYMKRRESMSEEDLYKLDLYKTFLDIAENKETNMDSPEKIKSFAKLLRVNSVYKGRNGTEIHKPSILFDSVGTNKYIGLAMHIINAILDDNILLIDEFDNSLHHKLTRVLVILMNSEANTKAQFIMTSHDVNLLTSKLFRKDQINFIIRDDHHVELVSLADFKANTTTDIRSSSNFEKMYVEEKIVPLPNTDIHQVIEEFK